MSSVAPSAGHRPSVRAGVLAALLALLLPVLAVSSASPARAQAACAASGPAQSYAGTGDGLTAGTAFQVETAAHLLLLATDSSNWDKIFVQTADIDLAGCTWTPIGAFPYFTGTYDGGGFKIRNLTISGQSYVGFFAETDGATLKNIHLVDVNITATGEYIAGLVGKVEGGSIAASSVSGTVSSSSSSVGGLVGYASSPAVVITKSSSSATVSGSSNIGGLVGDGNVQISESSAAGAVTGTGDAVGGLVGAMSGNGTEVVDSFATGAVQGQDGVGGLVGMANIGNNLRIIRSHATGAVQGRAGVGGLVGSSVVYCWNPADPATCSPLSLMIEGSFATGSVTGTSDVGCLIGAEDTANVTRVNSICEVPTTSSGSGSGPVVSFVAPGGVVPSLSPGRGEWVQADGSSTPLTVSSPGANQVRYAAAGIQVTLTGGAGSDASRGLVASPAGEVVCEVCAPLAADGVIEVWMFSSPRLVAAHLAQDLPCQTFTIPLVAPLDGGGPVAAGAHTLQLALPTAQGMQAVNVGVTVGVSAPTRVPAGEGPTVPIPVPVRLLVFGLLAAAGGLLAARRQVVTG